MRPLLSVKNLYTRFDTFDGSVFALNDVNFDLLPGETLAVVGESGSGKSVTMLSLLGLLPRNSARVTGKALFAPPDLSVDLLNTSRAELNSLRGNRISLIFQDALRSLNPVLTVGEQISESLLTHQHKGKGKSYANMTATGAAPSRTAADSNILGKLNPVLTVGEQISESLTTHKGYSKKTAYRRALELLEMVGIPQPDKRYYSYPHMFSGGMRQRAMIAIAISCIPDILIADEPTTALDVTIQAQIIELIRRLQQELGIAVIWITHDLGVVAGLADRVLVMYGGTAVEVAPVDELYETPGHPYTEGLLGAIPNLSDSGKERLVSIEGSPPDLFQEPCHCQFAWRCPYVFERCWIEIPPAYKINDSHTARCFYNLQARRPRAEV